MDHTDIISVDQVSMRFALASEKVDSLKEYFIKTLKNNKFLSQNIYFNEVPITNFIY